jgi:membrane protein implicated in regulation of membrane protease activity
VSTFFLVLLVVGIVLGVFAMLYGTERAAAPKNDVPHRRHSEHDPTVEPSPAFNLSSIAALVFATGLSGYLLLRYTSLSTGLTAAIAFTIGAAAFGLQALMIARWAIPSARADQMDERYLLQGTLGVVTQDIPDGGEGAIRYLLEGRDFAVPARNFEPGAMPAGTEVVIERVEHGVAFVELWANVEQRL